MGSSHEAEGQEVQLNLMTDGNQELGYCQARTHTAVLSGKLGQIVQFSHLSAAWLILLPLKNAQSIVPKGMYSFFK